MVQQTQADVVPGACVCWPGAGVAAGTGSVGELSGRRQVVDVPVTFDPGTYHFQCDPHVATGMKGELTVTG